VKAISGPDHMSKQAIPMAIDCQGTNQSYSQYSVGAVARQRLRLLTIFVSYPGERPNVFNKEQLVCVSALRIPNVKLSR